MFGGGGGGGPPKLTKVLKIVEKAMETCKVLKTFMNYQSSFYLKKANFNNNKGEDCGLLEIINNSGIN